MTEQQQTSTTINADTLESGNAGLHPRHLQRQHLSYQHSASWSHHDDDREETDQLLVRNNNNNGNKHSYGSWRQLMHKVGNRTIVLINLALCLYLIHAVWQRNDVTQPCHIDEQSPATSVDNTTKNKVPSWESLKAGSLLEGLKNGAVAADHPICSKVGVDILKAGGNAIDATVAVALCLGVANPASSGLGGGAFLLIHRQKPRNKHGDNDEEFAYDFEDAREYNKDSSFSGQILEVVDCREIAPSAARENMYQHDKDGTLHASDRGGLAIGVPGELKGLELAHVRHGNLPWGNVVEPALQLAHNGVRVNANLAHEIGILAHRYSLPANADWDFSALRKLLTHNDDWKNPLIEGDLLKNPALASTLQKIRDGGADALYKGDLAARLARDIQAAGGIVTQDDIENYRATLRSPLIAHDVYGFSIVGVPPPSSGGAAIIGAMRFLSDFTTPYAAFPESLSVHRIVEASKHVFAIRMSLSDPRYNTATVEDAVRDLVDGPYMQRLANLTRDESTLSLSQYGGEKWAQLQDSDGGKSDVIDAKEGDRKRRLARRFGYLEDGGTSHFSIVDKDGNAVSMTTSINTYFGSNVLSPTTGIILSNTMDDFATPGRPNYFGLHPSESNYIRPGKKPLSSMSPTMVFRRHEFDDPEQLGRLMLILGASGGPKIISAVLQVMANIILRGLSLFDALAHPRVHDQLIYNNAAVTTTEHSVLEQGLLVTVSNFTRFALEKRGHRLLDVDYEGTVQAIAIDLDRKEMVAACDLRKGGSPDGY